MSVEPRRGMWDVGYWIVDRGMVASDVFTQSVMAKEMYWGYVSEDMGTREARAVRADIRRDKTNRFLAAYMIYLAYSK